MTELTKHLKILIQFIENEKHRFTPNEARYITTLVDEAKKALQRAEVRP